MSEDNDIMLWPPEAMADLLDALARSADRHTNSYSETAHLCREGAKTIRHLISRDSWKKLAELANARAGAAKAGEA
jgi:uncharacterized alpha-E superfamily protein